MTHTFSKVWSSPGEKKWVLAKVHIVSSKMYGRLALFWKQLKANKGRVGGSAGMWGVSEGNNSPG